MRIKYNKSLDEMIYPKDPLTPILPTSENDLKEDEYFDEATDKVPLKNVPVASDSLYKTHRASTFSSPKETLINTGASIPRSR